MKREFLKIDKAVSILEVLGCGSDQIVILNPNSNFVCGEEAEVSELNEFQFLLSPYTASHNAPEIPAKDVSLHFEAHNGWVEGTLENLLLDRLRMFKGLDRIIPSPVFNKVKRNPKGTFITNRSRPVVKEING